MRKKITQIARQMKGQHRNLFTADSRTELPVSCAQCRHHNENAGVECVKCVAAGAGLLLARINQLRWITQTTKDVGTVLRDYRNYIHPQKDLSHGVSISDDDARTLWEVAKNVARRVVKTGDLHKYSAPQSRARGCAGR